MTIPPPPDFRPDAAQTQRLLRLHRRALAFRDAQRDADLVAEADLRYRESLAARCEAARGDDGGRILDNVSNLCRRRAPTSIDRGVLALRAELGRRPQRLLPVASDGTSRREALDLAAGNDPEASRMAATGPALAGGADFSHLELPSGPPPAMPRPRSGVLRLRALADFCPKVSTD